MRAVIEINMLMFCESRLIRSICTTQQHACVSARFALHPMGELCAGAVLPPPEPSALNTANHPPMPRYDDCAYSLKCSNEIYVKVRAVEFERESEICN